MPVGLGTCIPALVGYMQRIEQPVRVPTVVSFLKG
jgi:hypothetical protein